MLSANSGIILKKFLESSGTISISDIQESCDLSRKSVAYEIDILNDYLIKHGAKIQSTKGKGYEIEITDQTKYSILHEGFLYNSQRNQYLYFEKNLLAYQILFDLILQERYFSIDELAENYYCSRSTVSKSLKTVRTILAENGCELISRPNYGLKWEGPEWNKRVCIIHVDKIATRMEYVMEDSKRIFKKYIDKEQYSLREIERILVSIMHRYNLDMPLINLTKVKLYLMLTQTRAAYYDELIFNEIQLSEINQSPCLTAAREIGQQFRESGYEIRDNDEKAIAALLLSFCTIPALEKLPFEKASIYREYTMKLIHYYTKLYNGVERYLDETFIDEFVCALCGIQARTIFQLSAERESVYHVKLDGSFVSDLCQDFAVFYYQESGMKLPETEILKAYYIVHSSFARHESRLAKYKIVLISRYGINFARAAAAGLLDEYRNQIIKADVIEYTQVGQTNLSEYDFLITDIKQDHYDFVEIPIIHLDFFRNPSESRTLIKYLTVLTTIELEKMIIDKNIVYNKAFKSKQEVFAYLAENYVPYSQRYEFIENCIDYDSILSCERRNRIALISTQAKFYDKEEMVFIFNKNPFLWDDELVQLLIFFNRRNCEYSAIQIMNSALTALLHAHVGVVRMLADCDAEEIVNFIISEIYH